ncbi:MAG TPA: hypothetical protein VEI25_14100 [Paraburkholderia sp.]|nr:hypothetical protein [Paraburkholderia sp.]
MAAAPASEDPPGTRFEGLYEHAAATHEDHLLDESLMQTFPASDPIAPGFFS